MSEEDQYELQKEAEKKLSNSAKDSVRLEGKASRETIHGKTNDSLFAQKLQKIYLSQYPALFQYISRNIDLSSINILHSNVIQSEDVSSVASLPDDSFMFFLNLAQINNFCYLNKAFCAVNNILRFGGFFIGRFESLEQKKSIFP